MPASAKDKIVGWGAKACIFPLVGLYFCVKYTADGVAKIIDTGNKLSEHVRVKTRRLPKSRPLARASLSSKSRAPETTTSVQTSFLHLPMEIRLQIYRMALGDPAVVQVRLYSSFWGPRPDNWGPTQGIRDEADEPSAALRLIIGLGGSGLRQLACPPRRGCVGYPPVSQVICGEGQHFGPMSAHPENVVYYTDLMRACRVIYGELLDVLYAGNTISLFGSEIAQYFCRNASPEGLRRIRLVHVALIIPSSEWDSPSERKNIQGTMRMLRDSLHGLRQLDIEVVLLWGQPKDSQRFWAWLRNAVLTQLRDLERFVLKVTVYKPFPPSQSSVYPGRTPKYEPLETWNDDEYQDLKARVTSLEETILP
ncbi:hypothetical protein F4820DRAFT_404216 [Hypoxylon rubiginosum]|uniref:Uncharacterized protein n=1 Tax=Hypoxylon rubiginosum TaxID=110542 RepID=A0ACB9ZF11_9PEZI|nr:hypothetical protein F4820DRAFT_404216 [Hypoxylon rubiginosum]